MLNVHGCEIRLQIHVPNKGDFEAKFKYVECLHGNVLLEQ